MTVEIITKYIAAKGSTGPKVQAKANTGQKIIVDYDFTLNQENRHRVAAEALFNKLKDKSKRLRIDII